jgi:flagellar biogenesis protein FliO
MCLSDTKSCVFRIHAIAGTAVFILSISAFTFAQDVSLQTTETAEWADDASSDTTASAAIEPAAADAQAPAVSRTPIDREHSPTSDGATEGDARSASWNWTWLVIVVASVLWWLVGRLRRRGPLDAGLLPEGVVATLGRQSVGGGQSVQLIRIGSRILVVTPTAQGLRTLSEIADPQEVERLVSLCLQPQRGMPGIGGLFGGKPIVSLDNLNHSKNVPPARSQTQRTSQIAAERVEAAR